MLLLADAPVLRRGLVSMINETAGMQSVGTPGELRRALTLAESARPDAVVVELGLARAGERSGGALKARKLCADSLGGCDDLNISSRLESDANRS